MRIRKDAGKEGCRNGGMLESRGIRTERLRKGGMQEITVDIKEMRNANLVFRARIYKEEFYSREFYSGDLNANTI